MLISGCSKDEPEIEGTDVEQETFIEEFTIEELEDLVLNKYYEDDEPKNETCGTIEEFQLVLDEFKDIPQPAILKAAIEGANAGVIKSSDGCGSHREFIIYYDSEDHKPNNKKGGDFGAWEIGKNITMHFCVVDYNQFKAIGRDYGILLLGKYPASSSIVNDIVVTMHYENNNPFTSFNDNSLAGVTTIYKNARQLQLHIAYFKGTEKESNKLPTLDLKSYHVFGNIYGYTGWNNKYGYVYSDDEDSGNLDHIDFRTYDIRNNKETIVNKWEYEDWKYSKLVEQDPKSLIGSPGTTFYISKVINWEIVNNKKKDVSPTFQ